MDIDHKRVDPHRRQKSPVQEHVIDEFVGGRLSRREFIRYATIVGIGASSIGAILAACGVSAPSPSPTGTSGPAGATGSAGTSGKPGATIRVGMRVPSAAMTPLTASGGVGEAATVGLVGEQLTLVDENLNVQPWLAESWTPNSDASVWTFKIRQGVKWNDGTPLTVDDVVYTFKSYFNPEVVGGLVSYFGGSMSPEGVEKVDDTQVRFTLLTPNANWPALAVSSTNLGHIVVPNNYDFTKWETDFRGTGAFTMVNYKRLIGGTFVANPNYWGTPPKPAKIELTYYADEAALTSALAAGDIDVNDGFTVVVSPQLVEEGRFNVVATKSSEHRQVAMHTDTGPFSNKLVRQAMALTLNRPDIIQALAKGLADVGNDSPLAPAFPSTDGSVPQRAQDITKAKELMAQAGVPQGFSVQLAAPQGYGDLAQYAQVIKQSAAAIGIDIELSIMPESAYWGTGEFGSTPWFDSTMSLTPWFARGVPDTYLLGPLQTTDAEKGTGGVNAAHFSDPQYDKLSNEFVGAVDLSTRKKLSGEIQTLLLDQTPAIFAYFLQSLVASQKNVYGAKRVPTTQFYWDMTKS